MSTLGTFGFAMWAATLITAVGYLFAVLRLRAARGGYAALGVAILLMTWRIVGGVIGAVLGMIALWRDEPGTALLWVGLTMNVLFALSLVYRMLYKRFSK